MRFEWLFWVATGLIGTLLGVDATTPIELGWAGDIGQASASVILIGFAGYALKALIAGDLVPVAKHKEALSEMKSSIAENGQTASHGIEAIKDKIDAISAKIDRLL